MQSQFAFQQTGQPYVPRSRSPDFIQPEQPLKKKDQQQYNHNQRGLNLNEAPNQKTPHQKNELFSSMSNPFAKTIQDPQYVNKSYKQQTPRRQDESQNTANQIKAPEYNPIDNPRRINCVFAIFASGFGYDTISKSSGRASGLGFLVSRRLVLTAHVTLPTYETCLKSYAQFKDGEVVKFDPNMCFVSSETFHFTLVAFQQNNITTFFTPVNVNTFFSLKEQDRCFLVPEDGAPKSIIAVDDTTFTYSTGRRELIHPGTPVFDSEMRIQGIHHLSSAKFQVAVRIDCILSELERHADLHTSPLLDQLLRPEKEERLFNQARYVYYFQWFTRQAWRFDTNLKEWKLVLLRNWQQLEREYPNWSFNWNSRILYLPDTTVMLIGGFQQTTQKDTDEVWLFSPGKYRTLRKLQNMICPREAPAVCMQSHFIYVFGGKYALNSCERFSLLNRTWEALPPMYYGRWEASSVPFLKDFVFVLGGQPIQLCGVSIELLNTAYMHWEIIGIQLPQPLFRFAACQVSDRRILILGGKGNYRCYALIVENSQLYSGITPTSYEGYEQYYRIAALPNLEDFCETTFPASFDKFRGYIYLLNNGRLSRNGITPSVVSYKVEDEGWSISTGSLPPVYPGRANAQRELEARKRPYKQSKDVQLPNLNHEYDAQAKFIKD